jgi:peptidoglycan/LPS O-acetylase OafA/YrhL
MSDRRHMQPFTPAVALAPGAPAAVSPRLSSSITDVPSQRAAPIVAPRNDALDAVRFFAAAAVVLVHAVESQALGGWVNLFRFAVPFYLFASMYYQASSFRRRPDQPLGAYCIKRLKRLYGPFLAWSAIYFVARDIKRVTMIDYPPLHLSISMLWTGTEYHLWFLPFLLVASIVSALCCRAILRAPRLRWPAILLALAAMGMIVLAHRPQEMGDDFTGPSYAFWQMWWALTSVLSGMAFAWIVVFSAAPLLGVPAVVGIGGIVLAAWMLVQQALHGWMMLPRALAGFGCMLAALAPWRGPLVQGFARLGRFGYGIYLSHVLVVEMLRATMHHFGFDPTIWLDMLVFALGFAGSIAIAKLLARTPKLAWLNG